MQNVPTIIGLQSRDTRQDPEESEDPKPRSPRPCSLLCYHMLYITSVSF